MAIEQERFLKYRDELLQVLKENAISRADASLLCAAVLNEYFTGTQYGVSIMLVPLVFSNCDPQKGEG